MINGAKRKSKNPLQYTKSTDSTKNLDSLVTFRWLKSFEINSPSPKASVRCSECAISCATSYYNTENRPMVSNVGEF